MADPWFHTQSTGSLEVTDDDGSWIVTDPPPETRTVCLFEADDPDIETAPHQLEVTITNRRLTTGKGPNYLTVSRQDTPTPTESTGTSEPDEEYPEYTLQQFDGSGEWVTIEATIDHIEYIRKNTAKMPDVKGVLRESGSTKRLPFVVEDNTSHPYLEAGTTFRFAGVKDHRYERDNEVQVLITKQTQFTEL